MPRSPEPPPPRPPTPASRAVRGLPLLLLLATAVVYANSLSGTFVNDDRTWIQRDPEIRSLGNWRALLADTPRPLLKLSLAVDHALHGLDPRGYHATNAVVHALAGLALFGASRRTLRRLAARGRRAGPPEGVAFALALLWLVHPLQTQAVTYVIQRGESLMGLFYLLTLYAAVRHAEGRRRGLWVAAAALACALGMATKEVMITAPFVVLAWDWTFLSREPSEPLRRRAWLHAAVFAAWAGVAFGAIGFGTLVAGEFARPDLPTVGAWEYARSQPGVVLHYLRLAAWPHPLCFDYGWRPATGALEILLPAAVVGGLALATLVALARRAWPGFVGAWFFGILAPTSSFFPIQDLAVEHRMYLPLAAPLLLALLGARAALERLGPAPRGAAPALLGVVAVTLGALTVQRNADYRSALTLQQTIVAAAPDNPRAHYNLGTLLRAAGRDEEAVVALRRSLALDPDEPRAHYNLGNALRARGDADAAMAHYRRVLELEPGHAGARVNLGNALRSQGRLEEAAESYREALRRSPADARAAYNLGVALLELGRPEQALEALRRASRLRPAHAPTRNNLGSALLATGDVDGAVEAYRDAVRLDPRHARAHHNLGLALEARGDLEGARRQQRRALEIDPGYARARERLAALEAADAATAGSR